MKLHKPKGFPSELEILKKIWYIKISVLTCNNKHAHVGGTIADSCASKI